MLCITAKTVQEVSNIGDNSPEWFKEGVKYALKAPTARNMQRFYLEQTGDNTVRLTNLGGEYSKIDIGIVKLHFEIGAGKENFNWDDKA